MVKKLVKVDDEFRPFSVIAPIDTGINVYHDPLEQTKLTRNGYSMV